MTLKVKILKSESCGNWYDNKIGETYEVKEWLDSYYQIFNQPLGFLINKDDCEIVNESTDNIQNLEISKVMSFANWIGNERLYYSEVEGWWKLENGCIKNVAINTEVLLELFLTTNKID